MPRNAPRRPRPPLSEASLRDLALNYLGRFATTRAKLGAYLSRKVRERGWDGERPADIEGVIARMAELGYVDDAAFALSKARSLGARGYGRRRVDSALRAAGVEDVDSSAARDHAAAEAAESALRFARKRRIGPFAPDPADRAQKERMLAAMVRAGHDFALAKAILALDPGSDVEEILELGRRDG